MLSGRYSNHLIYVCRLRPAASRWSSGFRIESATMTLIIFFTPGGPNFAQMHLRIRTRVLTLSAWCASVFRHGLVLASKKEHTRLSKSAPATATRLTMPRHKCPPNRAQAHTLRLFSPKHSITPLPPCQSELDSPRLPPASAARLLWTSSAAPRGREGVCPGREVVRPRTANPV